MIRYIYIHYEMITTLKLMNTSITSHCSSSSLFWWLWKNGRSTVSENFRYTVWSYQPHIVTMKYVQFQSLFTLHTKVCTFDQHLPIRNLTPIFWVSRSCVVYSPRIFYEIFLLLNSIYTGNLVVLSFEPHSYRPLQPHFTFQLIFFLILV